MSNLKSNSQPAKSWKSYHRQEFGSEKIKRHEYYKMDGMNILGMNKLLFFMKYSQIL